METKFAGLLDLKAPYMLMLDYTRLHFPIIEYRVLDVEDVQLDEIHLEIDEGEKTFLPAVEIRAYAVPEEEQYTLSRYGLEQVRDLVVQVSIPDLIIADLATQDLDTFVVTPVLGIGDRFFYSDIEYDVLERYRGPSFGNTDIPLWFFLNCEKRRPSSEYYAGI